MVRSKLPATTDPEIILFGPITEVAPDAGIFEADITIRYIDGPAGTACPTTTAGGVDAPLLRLEDGILPVLTHCIQQGDILTVEYTDPTDASGDPNTVTINTDAPGADVDGIVDNPTDTLVGGDLTIHLRVNDPDFDISASGEDTISTGGIPPVVIVSLILLVNHLEDC